MRSEISTILIFFTSRRGSANRPVTAPFREPCFLQYMHIRTLHYRSILREGGRMEGRGEGKDESRGGGREEGREKDGDVLE